MIDDSTKKDIDQISLDVLKQSKALDVFPTPVDRIVQFADLFVNKQVDLVHVNDSFFTKLSGKLDSFVKQIRGVLDRRERVIYLDLSQSNNRQNFVKLHEAGHDLLSWQGATLKFLDDDDTLDASVSEQFEAEANYFASATLFQHDRFLEECEKLNLGLGAVMALSKKFGSSVHSAFRNYVLQSKNRCALLVLNHPVNQNGYVNILTTRDLFYSKKFQNDFGELSLPNEFGFKWAFVQDFKYRKNFHENGTISLMTTEGEEIDTNYHFFICVSA